MRATLNIPDDLIKTVHALSGEKSKTRAVLTFDGHFKSIPGLKQHHA